MIHDLNINLEVWSQSLPGRKVYMKMKFTNYEDQDFYFSVRALAGPSKGLFSVNNTPTSEYHGIGWEGCQLMSTGYGHSSRYNHIPASGMLDLTIDVGSHCGFLRNLPMSREYFFRYVQGWQEQGEHLPLLDEPNGECVGRVYIPLIELPFNIID